jgi:predicted nicotinamide N-methyase
MNLDQPAHQRPVPEIPPEALGPIARDQVIIDGRTFLIEHPGESDQLLDRPEVRTAFAADEYLPYWADLWPAARMLAKVVLREPWAPGLEALEVGCGLGLPGIAALAAGLRVTFSDYDLTALRFAAANARLNGFTDFRTLRLDWREPPAGLQVPVVLASDLIYEIRNAEPLAGVVKRVLAPGGVCLMTDQDRVPAHLLREALPAAGLMFTAQLVRAGEPGGRRYKGTLYRITHA